MGLKASKIIDCIEKCFQQKLNKFKFPTKIRWARVFISPRNGARGHQRFATFEIMHRNEKLGSFGAECCQKYRLYREVFQSKVVQN